MNDDERLLFSVFCQVGAWISVAGCAYGNRERRKAQNSIDLVESAVNNSKSDTISIGRPICLTGNVYPSEQRALLAADGQPAAFVYSQQGRRFMELSPFFYNGVADIGSYKAVEVPWGITLIKPVNVSVDSSFNAGLSAVDVESGAIGAAAKLRLSSLMVPPGRIPKYPMPGRTVPELDLMPTFQTVTSAAEPHPRLCSLAPTGSEMQFLVADRMTTPTGTWLTKMLSLLGGKVLDGSYIFQRYLPLGALVSVVGKLTYRYDGQQSRVTLGPLNISGESIFVFPGAPSAIIAALRGRQRLMATLMGCSAVSAAVLTWTAASLLTPRIVNPWTLATHAIRWLDGDAPRNAFDGWDEPPPAVVRAEPEGHVDADELAGVDQPAANDGEECVICRLNRPIVAYVPCGHLSLCLQCGRHVLQREHDFRCAMCNREANGLIRVFGLPEQRNQPHE